MVQPDDKTLLEQLSFSTREIDSRRELLLFSHQDAQSLASCRPLIEHAMQLIVRHWCEELIRIPEVTRLINDSETLQRLRVAQRAYVLDLFGGHYGPDYVNTRLHIGLSLKRLGVESKVYLAGASILKELLSRVVTAEPPAGIPAFQPQAVLSALDKLIQFDAALVVDTHLRIAAQEMEAARAKVSQYALSLEKMVRERTQQLEDISRIDPLTGVSNRRHLNDAIDRVLRAAQRRHEPVTALYFDVNDFKYINDHFGHLYGDKVLAVIGELLRTGGRSEDLCFRYGGDEFFVLLPNCHEDEARNVYWRRLRARFAERFENVTLSMGVYQTGPESYDSPENLIKLADTRMYEAKRHFKDTGTSDLDPLPPAAGTQITAH